MHSVCVWFGFCNILDNVMMSHVLTALPATADFYPQLAGVTFKP